MKLLLGFAEKFLDDACDSIHCQSLVKPPLMPGEMAHVVKTTDGCCDKYEVVCKPETCAVQPPTCSPPQVMRNSNPGACCPTFKCECPLACPMLVKPSCPTGKIPVVIDTSCNCSTYMCLIPVPHQGPQLCWYKYSNGTSLSFQVNQSWTDGACRSCQCHGLSGGVETVCHTERCSACPQGTTVDHSDSSNCCGTCRQTGCVVDGHTYRDGEALPNPMKCYKKICSASTSGFIIRETQVACPKDNLPACTGKSLEYDSSGCCPTCVITPTSSSLINTCTTCQPVPQFDSPSLTIGYFSVVEGNSTTCQNKEPLPDLKQCSGHCESRATYTAVMQGFDSNCQCCQPSRTVTRTAVLTCSDGSTRSRSYSVPEACGCSACSGTT